LFLPGTMFCPMAKLAFSLLLNSVMLFSLAINVSISIFSWELHSDDLHHRMVKVLFIYERLILNKLPWFRNLECYIQAKAAW
jgi:hypothetical protein